MMIKIDGFNSIAMNQLEDYKSMNEFLFLFSLFYRYESLIKIRTENKPEPLKSIIKEPIEINFEIFLPLKFVSILMLYPRAKML